MKSTIDLFRQMGTAVLPAPVAVTPLRVADDDVDEDDEDDEDEEDDEDDEDDEEEDVDE